MKTLFIGKSGRLLVDKVKDNVMLFEAPDGYHFITPDAVIPSSDGKERLIVMGDGALCAFGAQTTKDAVEDLLKVISLAKWAEREGRLGISTMLGRAFANFIRYFPYVIIMIVLLAAFLGGGVK